MESNDASLKMSRSSSSIGPLSVGNVVSAGLRLYRDNLKTYLGVALTATLWGFVPLVFNIFMNVLTAAGSEGNALLGLIVIIAFFAWLVAIFYCGAKSLQNAALISRLAFGMLTNQPETKAAANKNIKHKMWSFLLVQIVLFLIIFVAIIGAFLLLGLFLAIVGSVLGEGNPLLILFSLFGFLCCFGFYLWIYARFFISEVPLAIENNVGTLNALNRSWSLSKGMVRQIALVIFVSFLITIPIYFVAFAPLLLSLGAIVSTFSGGILGSGGGLAPTAVVAQFLGLFLLTILFLFAANLATLSFWQTIKAVIYYDLRNRKEGLDLQLRDSV